MIVFRWIIIKRACVADVFYPTFFISCLDKSTLKVLCLIQCKIYWQSKSSCLPTLFVWNVVCRPFWVSMLFILYEWGANSPVNIENSQDVTLSHFASSTLTICPLLSAPRLPCNAPFWELEVGNYWAHSQQSNNSIRLWGLTCRNMEEHGETP